jgi:hypothetical protein
MPDFKAYPRKSAATSVSGEQEAEIVEELALGLGTQGTGAVQWRHPEEAWKKSGSAALGRIWAKTSGPQSTNHRRKNAAQNRPDYQIHR